MLKRIICLIGCLALVCMAHSGNEALYGYLDSASEYLPNSFSLTVGEEIRYEDNIAEAVKSEEVSSYIFETNIELSLLQHRDWISYGLACGMAYEHYTRHSGDFSNVDYYVLPVIDLDVDMNNGLWGGALQLTFDSNSSMEVVEVGQNNEYARNYTNGMRFVWDMNRHARWGLIVSGEGYYEYYPENDFDDLSRWTYNAGVLPYYVMNKYLKVGVSFDYEKVDYDRDRLSDSSNKYSVGGFFDLRISEKTKLTVKMGLEKSDYDGISGHDSDNQDTTFFYDFVYRYKPVTSIAFDLNLSRSQENHTRSRGMTLEDKYGLRMTWAPIGKIIITNSFLATHDDERFGRADKMEYLYELDVKYRCNQYLTFYTGYSYEISHNIKDHRFDNDVNIVRMGTDWKF